MIRDDDVRANQLLLLKKPPARSQQRNNCPLTSPARCHVLVMNASDEINLRP